MPCIFVSSRKRVTCGMTVWLQGLCIAFFYSCDTGGFCACRTRVPTCVKAASARSYPGTRVPGTRL
eukprot:142563-Rhodomonas_salina.1